MIARSFLPRCMILAAPLLSCIVVVGQDRPEYWTREFTVDVQLNRNTRAVDLKTIVGSIEVVPGEDGAELHAVVKARQDLIDEDEVSDRAEDHFSVQRRDGRLIIESLHVEEDQEGPNIWQVSFTLSVPRPMAVAATTSVGDVGVVGVDGSAQLHAGVGNVTLESDSADSVSAVAGVGDVAVQCASVGGSLEVKSGTGSVALAIGSVSENAVVSTSVGDVTLDCARGLSATIEMSTGVGRIRATGTSLDSTRRGVGAQASAELGQGGRRIGVSTGVGDITVRRGGALRDR